MPNRKGYARCPVCRMERQTTGTGKMVRHNRWNGREMVKCDGEGKRPAVGRA